jgi:hypothetical protein
MLQAQVAVETIIHVAIKLNGNNKISEVVFFLSLKAYFFLANKLVYNCFIEFFKFIIANTTAAAITIIKAVLPESAAEALVAVCAIIPVARKLNGNINIKRSIFFVVFIV